MKGKIYNKTLKLIGLDIDQGADHINHTNLFFINHLFRRLQVEVD